VTRKKIPLSNLILSLRAFFTKAEISIHKKTRRNKREKNLKIEAKIFSQLRFKEMKCLGILIGKRFYKRDQVKFYQLELRTFNFNVFKF